MTKYTIFLCYILREFEPCTKKKKKKIKKKKKKKNSKQILYHQTKYFVTTPLLTNITITTVAIYDRHHLIFLFLRHIFVSTLLLFERTSSNFSLAAKSWAHFSLEKKKKKGTTKLSDMQ